MSEGSPSDPLKVAVIGIGRMGRIHARIVSDLAETELVAVVDADPKNGSECAEKHGTQALSDYRMLENLDAVIVASPTVTHAEIACHFLNQGVSVLVEKPIAATLKEADTMLEAEARSGAKLQIGHVERFNPAVMALAERIEKPRFIVSERISPFSFRSMDIGVVLDLMIHDIDIILHLNGTDVKKIEAVGFGFMTNSEDVANARITFEDGCVADVTASRLSDKTVRHIRIFADDRYVSMDYAKQKAVMYQPTEKLMAADFDASKIDLSYVKELKDAVFPDLLSVEEIIINEHEPLAVEVQSFVKSIIDGSEPLITGLHGRRALATAIEIEGIIKSLT
jgi:predicted dehydrogenase